MFGDNKATSDDSSMIQHLEESFEIDLKAQAIKMHMEATEEIHDKTIGDQKESVIFDQWTAYIPETGAWPYCAYSFPTEPFSDSNP